MSNLTDEQVKVNKIAVKGLSLNEKLDLFFNELYESMKTQLGEEVLNEDEKVVKPITKRRIKKIDSPFYDLRYEFQKEFTRENIKRVFNLFFSDEEKLEIRKAIEDFLFDEGYEDRHQIIATTKKYHKLCSEILKMD